MRRVAVFCTLLGSILVASGSNAYQWPLRTFGNQHQINSTLGEYRSSNFHSGVDIDTTGLVSTWVYPVTSDTARPFGAGEDTYVRVGNYFYIHLRDTTSERYVVAYTDSVGRIYSHHLHLREDQPFGRPINPLRSAGLSPYQDNVDPQIDSIKFYRQGDTTQLTGILDGKVDILSVAMDLRTDTIGGSAGPGVSVYRIGYEIRDTSGAVRKPYWEGIIFDSLPGSGLLDTVYASGSSYEPPPPHFRYWVTNDPFNFNPGNRDWYWNTKQDSGSADSVDADSIEEAVFPRGNYWVNVYAYDVDSNFCAESVQVYIDNFAPRVDSVHPDSGATNVPLDTKMEVQFNEPMNQNVDLDCVITLTPGAMVSWQWLDSTKVRGIPIPSLEPNTTYLVSVKAYDGVDSLKDMAGWLFDGNGDGQPGGDHIWGFTTGDTMAAWPTSEPQWEGVERSGCDSVDLFSNPYLPLLCGSLSFSFCGMGYSDMTGSECGSIWFDTAKNIHHFDLPSEKVVAVHNDGLEAIFMQVQGKLYARENYNPNRALFEWHFREGSDVTNFEAILFEGGWVRFDYKLQEIQRFYSDSGSGISCGNDTNYIRLPPIYNVAPASFMFGPNVPPGNPRDLEPEQGSLKLVWDTNPESDLMGYYVYRASGIDTTDTASLSRLCDTSITDTSYVDSGALPCSTYWYAVSAADTLWWEGGMSNKVVGVVPPVPGACSTGTAYNNGRKIVKDKEQLRFYVTYTSDDSVWTTFTDCEGCLWNVPYAVGNGKLPSVDSDTSNSVWVVWVGGSNDDVVFYSQFNGVSWTSKDTLFDFQGAYRLTALSFSMDNIARGNVLVDSDNSTPGLTPPTSFKTFLIRFNPYQDTLPWVTTVRSSPMLNARSAIDCDGDGNLHVVWDEGNLITYRKGVSSGDTVVWQSPQTISAPPVPSKYPCIEYDNDSVSVVWQALSAGSYQISHRRKAISDSIWLSIERVDTSDAFNSTYPVLTGRSKAVWVEELNPNSIFYSERQETTWTDPKNIKSTAGHSRFPHARSYKKVNLTYTLVCWTKDLLGSGYGIESHRELASTSQLSGTRAAQFLKRDPGPRIFTLAQNAPNPFIQMTHISFTLPKSEHVVLDIYNVAGQRVRRLADEWKKTGKYELTWDGKNEHKIEVGSGVYFARLTAGSFRKTRKMVLVR